MWKYRSADAIPESEFLEARKGEGRRSVAVERWYAVKAAPGAQRCPSIRIGQDRKGESIVERNLRNEGFEAFMPSYRIDVRHHRQGHWIERRFPIFVGYLFVNIGPHDYRAVEAVDGVSKILRYSKRYAERPMPFEFAQETVDRLRYIAWEQEQTFLVARARRQREEEIEQEQRRRGKPVNASSRRIRRAQFTDLGGCLASSLSSASSRAFITETLETLSDMAVRLD
ncbi:transcription termination/antitermination NusG family protein [Rhizobium leguminosarum]|uniref:transcription termination/antitermination NusG family protein n=1 Tax=Rhizobium leguminosarum TaxID=384 RepID=UPI001C97C6AF|nr:transcription termination/antitermination NusG family protein [Rhizobium leguminosarum]MBY5374215.1 hypothetical protein [Rhizobium leguminosarum]